MLWYSPATNRKIDSSRKCLNVGGFAGAAAVDARDNGEHGERTQKGNERGDCDST
jgi:hypothetical protein